MNNKARSGSAMGLVLVFMVIMIILGTGVLAMAQYGAMHSAGTLQADKHYYAAESATQLASQMLIEELNTLEEVLYSEDPLDTEDDLSERITGELEPIVESIKEKLADITFNGEAVSLEIDLSEIEVIKDEDVEAVGQHFVYMNESPFVINATSGGRTVSAKIAYQPGLDVDIIINPDEAIPMELDGGAYFQDKAGGIYGEGGYATYNTFYDAMVDLFENARTLDVIDQDIPDDAWHTISSGALNSTAVSNHKYIKYTGNNNTILDLGNNSASALALEYLDVTGNLVISGTNYVPNLKGVRVTGTITISSGAKIYGRENGMVSPYGTNFASEGNITVNSGTQVVNWCRFYAQGANITINSDNISTNSVFVAVKNSSGGEISIPSSQYQVDTTGYVPQFYAETKLFVNLQNRHTSVVGIFGTLNQTDQIFRVQGNAVGCEVRGVVIGLCDALNQSGYSLEVLDPTQNSSLMNEGVLTYIDDAGYITIPGGITTTITYKSGFDGLAVREITGE